MRRLLPALALATLATPAAAHLPHGAYGSVAAGLTHPLFGLDHVLAMVAVGLWASVLGGRALWALPAAFVGAMVAGYGLALAGAPLPGVEPMILASIVVLGLGVAFATRHGVAASALVVAAFALFHGHAHGGELGGAGAWRFGLGFVLATAALHGAGVAAGLGLGRLGGGRSGAPVRAVGPATALAGVALAIG